ncbi:MULTISPECIES: hypothetical protein [unclassified Streptomyces]|uniref:hypothetical protein n=1 Tax=unclassified Streptomyces TaxID=2593676 RepID=UPI002E2BDB90|nr:hypothetical protein [Streptomyces sp. NBC_01439]
MEGSLREVFDHLLGLSERDLDLLIAEHLLEHDLGSRDDDDEERVFIARRWFASIRGRLRSVICGHEEIQRAAENPGENDQFLVAAIVDALLAASFKIDIPVTVLSVKIAHMGIRKICSADS